MTVSEVRKKYLEFFKSKGHAILPSSPLIPENDPTTLFTGSGMQPMVPYLLGEKHPSGKRIADSQKCFRAQDIEEVGDNRHTTFFEMLGNWSLGDYFKKEQLQWIFEFLADEIRLDPKRLYFTAFAGDEKNGIPRDTESAEILRGLFEERDIEAVVVDMASTPPSVPPLKRGEGESRIFYYDAKKNWWSRAGVPENMPVGEPGGPDSEIFFDFRPEAGDKCIQPGFSEYCHPNCDCGRFMEIGNSVFMEYRKIPLAAPTTPPRGLGPPYRSCTPFASEDGRSRSCEAPSIRFSPPRAGGGGSAPFSKGRISPSAFEKLPQQNVDFGGGLERIAAATNPDVDDVFMLDVFHPLIRGLESASGKFYADSAFQKSFRIVAEHLRAAVFLIADGAHPSNTDQGYFTRRLIRRAVRHLDLLGIKRGTLKALVESVILSYKDSYLSLHEKRGVIEGEIEDEEEKFRKTLERGLKEFNWRARTFRSGLAEKSELSASIAFELFTTYGFPFELIVEEARERGLSVDKQQFQNRMVAHQIQSRAGAPKKFKGGLADTSEMSVKYHTATHLLHQALRDVLGDEVRQKGSNITPERLRFDFAFGRKMTDEEKQKVEAIVNEKIRAKLPMQRAVLPRSEAERSGALHFFGEKYGDEVSVYFIGESLPTAYSKEFCGGPHVEHTGVLGTFKIVKEEAVSAGVRRIKAVLN